VSSRPRNKLSKQLAVQQKVREAGKLIAKALEHNVGRPLCEKMVEDIKKSLLEQIRQMTGTTNVRIVETPPEVEAEQRLDGTFDPARITVEFWQSRAPLRALNIGPFWEKPK
jgi:hypothetical protein